MGWTPPQNKWEKSCVFTWGRTGLRSLTGRTAEWARPPWPQETWTWRVGWRRARWSPRELHRQSRLGGVRPGEPVCCMPCAWGLPQGGRGWQQPSGQVGWPGSLQGRQGSPPQLGECCLACCGQGVVRKVARLSCSSEPQGGTPGHRAPPGPRGTVHSCRPRGGLPEVAEDGSTIPTFTTWHKRCWLEAAGMSASPTALPAPAPGAGLR